jgi:hypothetical protein
MSDTSNAIELFWSFFSKNNHKASDVNNNLNQEFFQQIGQNLKLINENLTYQISLPKDSDNELILSADGVEASFPYVEELYKSKPLIEGWSIKKYRQALENIEDFSITLDNNIEISFKDVLFHLEKDNLGIVVMFFIPGFQTDKCEHEVLKWLILDACLGEYDAVKKVGYCAAYPLEEADNRALKSVTNLKKDFDEMFFANDIIIK